MPLSIAGQRKEGICTKSFYRKIVVTGNIVEVWSYEKLNTKGGNNPEGVESDGSDPAANYELRQRKRRNRIRQLICSNFDEGSKFVTLTFADRTDFDITCVQACNAFFKRFVQRVKYRYPEFKYVAVIEFQDSNGRGAVHYHMVCNLPFLRKAEIADLWQGGFVQVNRIDHVDNVGAYVVKYMLKDTEDPRLMGENAYLHSRGLNEPYEVTSWSSESSEFWSVAHALQKELPSYSAKYESKYAGEVCYCQYNFNRRDDTITE